MRFTTITTGLLACVAPLASATALTYKLQANEKACFFSAVDTQGAKVAFYFAVSWTPIPGKEKDCGELEAISRGLDEAGDFVG
jgi:hypothetical protein